MDVVMVLFRKWKGDIIALFPQLEGSKPGLVTSYMHIGQHGDADYFGIMAESKPAKPHEYEDLRTELEQIGYSPKIIKRGSQYLWWR